MIGAALKICVNTKDSEEEGTFYFPAGAWCHVSLFNCIEGPQEITISRVDEPTAVYQRPGTVVPIQNSTNVSNVRDLSLRSTSLVVNGDLRQSPWTAVGHLVFDADELVPDSSDYWS